MSAAMADVRPLRALHYDLGVVGSLQSVIAPPYDVIDPEQRARLAARSPHNVVNVDLPEDPLGAIRKALADQGAAGGCFRIRIPSSRPIYRVSDTIGNLAVDLFRIALGDHGIFCRREAFVAAGPAAVGRADDRSDLVNRTAERDQLCEAYRGVILDRRARIVTVRGPSGIGKTRLVREAMRDAGADAVFGTKRPIRCRRFPPTNGYMPGVADRSAPTAIRWRDRSTGATYRSAGDQVWCSTWKPGSRSPKPSASSRSSMPAAITRARRRRLAALLSMGSAWACATTPPSGRCG